MRIISIINDIKRNTSYSERLVKDAFCLFIATQFTLCKMCIVIRIWKRCIVLLTVTPG